MRPRCQDCNHTAKAHTRKAHQGTGGCAYCKCPAVLR